PGQPAPPRPLPFVRPPTATSSSRAGHGPVSPCGPRPHARNGGPRPHPGRGRRAERLHGQSRARTAHSVRRAPECQENGLLRRPAITYPSQTATGSRGARTTVFLAAAGRADRAAHPPAPPVAVAGG